MNIGIYGGTFDPPHIGHVTAAKAAMEVLGLDKLAPQGAAGGRRRAAAAVRHGGAGHSGAGEAGGGQ